jgi:hypothetical protein
LNTAQFLHILPGIPIPLSTEPPCCPAEANAASSSPPGNHHCGLWMMELCIRQHQSLGFPTDDVALPASVAQARARLDPVGSRKYRFDCRGKVGKSGEALVEPKTMPETSSQFSVDKLETPDESSKVGVRMGRGPHNREWQETLRDEKVMSRHEFMCLQRGREQRRTLESSTFNQRL